MTVYLEMAVRLQQEIEVAESHLANLKAALAGLQPLLVIESAPTPRALAYTPATVLVQEVEAADLEAPLKKSRRPRAAKEKVDDVLEATAQSEPAIQAKLPSTNSAFWKKLMGKRRYTIAEIVDRAVAELGAVDDSRAVFANRFQAWIYPAIKSGAVEAAGVKGKYKAYKATSP